MWPSTEVTQYTTTHSRSRSSSEIGKFWKQEAVHVHVHMASLKAALREEREFQRNKSGGLGGVCYTWHACTTRTKKTEGPRARNREKQRRRRRRLVLLLANLRQPIEHSERRLHFVLHFVLELASRHIAGRIFVLTNWFG